MKDYFVGCNYWASHAGTEMWAKWDEAVVDRDFEELAKFGVRTLRVFPNWRDFQPIQLLRCHGGQEREYRMYGTEKLKTPFDLDEACMENFHTMCRLAQKHGLTLLVGIVTGWMSGRLFVPPMLEGKNVITDSECLMWEHRFVRSFVRQMKDEPAIVAWDLGNECNCMGNAPRPSDAYIWLMTISNAIRLEDGSRPVISGMHGITPDGSWQFSHQGELTDMVTPHPYPSIFSNQDTEPLNELKTTMYPTAQVMYYAGMSGKPAMIEETGTFNDMLGNEDVAATYLNTSLFSGWANGSTGVLWWCAHDQKLLDFPPYDWNLCENELGLLRQDYSPKKVALTMRRFTQMLETMPFDRLPERKTEAVCILTREQNPLMVSLAATVLSKQAGFDLKFAPHDQPIPESEIYMLPCLTGATSISILTLNELFARVERGATMYISLDTGLINEFEKHTGLKPVTRQNRSGTVELDFDGEKIPFAGGKELTTEPAGCEVLGRDGDGTILFSRYHYGNGWVYLLSAPMEKMLAETPGCFWREPAKGYWKIYREFARPQIEARPVEVNNSFLGLTLHPLGEDDIVAIVMNYSSKPRNMSMKLKDGWRAEELFGEINNDVPANDAVVFRLRRN